MVIDSHHHLWRYTDEEFGWISDDSLRRDFTADDIQGELSAAGVDRTVVCEARQTVEETDMLLATAATNDFIAGVVGWLPIADDARFPALLEKYVGNRRLVGLRHVVQDEPDDAFILRPDFVRGVRRLLANGLAYDILVFERHLPNAIKFVDSLPDDSRLVLDHLGKPRDFSSWKALVESIAERQNVCCKVSGLVTELAGAQIQAHGTQSAAYDFSPYLETVLEAFGPDRLMFGSDWPVVTAHMTYSDWKDAVERFAAPLSQAERDAVMGGTAERVYRLP